MGKTYAVYIFSVCSSNFPQSGEMYVENRRSCERFCALCRQQRREKKQPTLYPDDALLSKLDRKRGEDKKQEKSSEGANLNTSFSFLYAQMSLGTAGFQWCLCPLAPTSGLQTLSAPAGLQQNQTSCSSVALLVLPEETETEKLHMASWMSTCSSCHQSCAILCFTGWLWN